MNSPDSALFPSSKGNTGRHERDAASLILALQAHRRQRRDQPGYWDAYCALMRSLSRATAVLLVQRKDVAAGWALLGQHAGDDDWASRHWQLALEDLGERALDKGYAFTPMQDDARRLRILAMVRTSGIGDALLVIDIAEQERGQLNEILMRAMLAADFPEPAHAVPAPASSALAPVPAATVAARSSGPMLDLAAQVMHEQRFGAATLLLVNGIGAHFGAEQVALGWLRDGAMHAVAISHIDRFEHNTQLVQLIEDAFREALGQPGALWHQAGTAADTDPLCAAHAKLCRMLKFARLHAVPVTDGAGVARAVLLLGFKEALPAPPASADLLLAMGFLQPWLHDLQQRDRWWGARFADWARQRLARLIGPGRVWSRVATVAASALLLFAIFGQWDYRIEATSQLTTDSMRLISAQFDGRVEQVHVSAGDVVREGALMATLDTRELRQQEMDILADRQRLEAEADKARAAGNLAEMGIAQARHAQADARLVRIVQYLAQARALAPFDGVVVSGERKELLNAPVKKGDNLFRVARIDGLYVEILVPERDVRYVGAGATGELRLLSHPDQKIRFKTSAMIPIAQVKGQEGNHFLIKARLLQAPEAWWRPGMSGIVLIDGGRQNVTWILTHKLVDTLRMKLWWLL
jgi:multidrug efflux pump subunit AcrA (membrane-fusion protein)